jgi:CRISPR/Cas system CSM-associated protein Csm4 (group 5 of RAMP superfamily)
MSQAEFVDRPEITFTVSIAKDSPELLDAIPELWVRMQDLGMGAMRSSGFGVFDLTAWTETTAVRKAA